MPFFYLWSVEEIGEHFRCYRMIRLSSSVLNAITKDTLLQLHRSSIP